MLGGETSVKKIDFNFINMVMSDVAVLPSYLGVHHTAIMSHLPIEYELLGVELLVDECK